MRAFACDSTLKPEFYCARAGFFTITCAPPSWARTQNMVIDTAALRTHVTCHRVVFHRGAHWGALSAAFIIVRCGACDRSVYPTIARRPVALRTCCPSCCCAGALINRPGPSARHATRARVNPHTSNGRPRVFAPDAQALPGPLAVAVHQFIERTFEFIDSASQ